MNYLIYSYSTATRDAYINGYHQNANMDTSAYISPFIVPSAPLLPTNEQVLHTLLRGGLQFHVQDASFLSITTKVFTNWLIH